MIEKIAAEDAGRRVRYRPAPSATETLTGVLVRSARGKEPCAMVLFDGDDKERIAYLKSLEWADE